MFKRRKTGLNLNISRNSYENVILTCVLLKCCENNIVCTKNWFEMLIFHLIRMKKSILHQNPTTHEKMIISTQKNRFKS